MSSNPPGAPGAPGADQAKGRLFARPGVIAAFVALVVGVAFVVVAVAVATRSNPPSGIEVPPTSSTLQNGKLAPLGFDLTRLGGGQRINLARLAHGKPVVLNLFASWCQDCIAELHAFSIASRTSGTTVRFIGIDTNDSNPTAALSLAKKAGIRYPLAADTSNQTVLDAYGVNGLPATFFISRSGHVIFEVLGKETLAGLRARVHTLATTK